MTPIRQRIEVTLKIGDRDVRMPSLDVDYYFDPSCAACADTADGPVCLITSGAIGVDTKPHEHGYMKRVDGKWIKFVHGKAEASK